MSFIDEFDNLPDDTSRTKLFFRWLNEDWRGLFAELRQRRPILKVAGFFHVVTRWSDVTDALSRSRTFQVPYAPKIDESVGRFMLGHDNCELNWRDKSVMRTLLRWEDLDAIRKFSGQTAATALSGVADVVDIPKTVSRLVPLRVVQHCFGFSGPDDDTMLRWSEATQTDMFRNLINDPRVHNANLAAGTAMQEWVRGFVSRREPWSNAIGEDTISRLLRLTASGLSGFDLQSVVSNICGLLVGTIETTSQAIVNATEQLLLRPEVAANAIVAAVTNDTTTLDAIVWEALRFNPVTTLIVRKVSEAALLAPGTDHEAPVTTGEQVAAAIGSAMFDPSIFTQPDSFRARPRDSYLHMGFGAHECLGQYIAFAIVPETIRQLLLLPGIHLLSGNGSQISYKNTAFPQQFIVGLGAAPRPEQTADERPS